MKWNSRTNLIKRFSVGPSEREPTIHFGGLQVPNNCDPRNVIYLGFSSSFSSISFVPGVETKTVYTEPLGSRTFPHIVSNIGLPVTESKRVVEGRLVWDNRIPDTIRTNLCRGTFGLLNINNNNVPMTILSTVDSRLVQIIYKLPFRIVGVSFELINS